MINNYYIKYLKYKNKYINLTRQIGGYNRTQIGGYNQTQILVSDVIRQMINYKSQDNFNLLHNETFTLVQGEKNTIYRIDAFLGKGDSSSVFRISSGGVSYVIKIGKQNAETALKEMDLLETLMRGINAECDYKSISGGYQEIDGVQVYHMIFPFKGNSMNITPENLILIPSFLIDIINCLKKINLRGFHGNLKSENIAISESNRAFIIDYRLGQLYQTFDNTNINFLIEKELLFRFGTQETFIDNIIIYKLRKLPAIHKRKMNLYDTHANKILQTIDNFGLFWLIINCFNIYLHEYIKPDSFVNIKSDDELYNLYIKLYFDLNPPQTEFEFKILELFNIALDSIDKTFRQHFIDEVYGFLQSKNVFNTIFKDYDNFNKFMDLILNLITIDPERRITIQELTLEQFFKQ